MKRTACAVAAWLLVSCQAAPSHAGITAAPSTAQLASLVRSDSQLQQVLAQGRQLVTAGGLRAGGAYPETWIRDLATFLPLYLTSGGDAAEARRALLTFVAFQQPDGSIPDGFEPATSDRFGTVLHSPLAPGLIAFTNTVESDQESALVQAFATYINATGDAAILATQVGADTVLQHIEVALGHVLTARLDRRYGLVWSGATVDWGDVEAGPTPSTSLGPGSDRAIAIYANAMFSLALRDFVSLPGVDSSAWRAERDVLDRNIRHWLWDAKAGKFRAHIYLDRSPFPADFDESTVTVHGGTAVAILAGLLSASEVRRTLRLLDADVLAAHAATIGLTVYPPYPEQSFGVLPGDLSMSPWSYQNGGEWDWFGARMVQALVAYHDPVDAYRELRPMVSRVVTAHGFYEWWGRDNTPHGSSGYRGSAGELGLAIQALLKWAGRDEPASLGT